MEKTRFYVVFALLVCLIAVIVISCGDKYPDISGDWEITEHCEPSQVGLQFTIEQDGPDFTISITINEEDIEWEGTIDEDGNIEIDGEMDGEPMEITGEFDGDDTITLVADTGEGPCEVVAVRQ
jgi:hypothetical protein